MKRLFCKERAKPFAKPSLSIDPTGFFFSIGSHMDQSPVDCGKSAIRPINGASYPY